MKIQSPPGMRDFYPEEQRLQNWLFDHWRRVARTHGFEEYEGPIFEYLDLYRVKSGEGIVSELFHFTDRGEREFAIRPEMTPTLARMVAARANALPRPIKWFSVPRMCRAEKPQRGRLREFFQWNVDVLGVDSMLADAEVIATAVAFLRAVGLQPSEVQVRVSSRQIASAALAALGIAPADAARAFQLIDRFEKLGADEFARQWNESYGAAVGADRLLRYLTEADLEACLALVDQAGDAGVAARENFHSLWQFLRDLDVAEYCAFDLRIVRGLAYYTGPVFEVAAQGVSLRALAGGGRYDDLASLLDGPAVPGVGFGMGDAPMIECLRELNRLPEFSATLDAFVIDASGELFPQVLALVSELRSAGLAVDFSYKRQNVGKQFKQASGRRARFAVIVGGELAERDEVQLKDLGSGDQRAVRRGQVADEVQRQR